MSKTYVAPTSAMIKIQTEGGVLAGSTIPVKPGTSGDGQLSQQGGWKSEDWSGAEE